MIVRPITIEKLAREVLYRAEEFQCNPERPYVFVCVLYCNYWYFPAATHVLCTIPGIAYGIDDVRSRNMSPTSFMGILFEIFFG